MSKASATLLQQNRAQLNSTFLKTTASSFLKENARIIDNFFLESFVQSKVGPLLISRGTPCAIIALGGYGRDEQCVHSDVDILILFEKKVPAEAEDLIREIIYPLWDIGMDIGHATRSIDECLQLAAKDLEVLTSLLDARFLCGMSPLFHQLVSGLNDKVVQSSQGKIINWIKTSCSERHESFGDSSDLIEPHLKNGMGGLRDYHTMLWLGRIRFEIKEPGELLSIGFLSKSEYEALADALEFIWNVRNRLHLLTNRKCDQLHFEYQAQIAKSFKFRKQDGQQPVERFMGVLHAKMEFLKQHHLMILSEFGQTKPFFLSPHIFKRCKVPGLVITKSMLNFADEVKIDENPELLIKIFLESSRLKLPLSSSAKRIVAEHGALADEFRYSKETTKTFERIMASVTPEHKVLTEMLSTGFLFKLIPEFKKISNRIQYNQYHIYPVDRHSIHVLQAVLQFSSKDNMLKEPLYGNLYKEVSNKKVLHWASLFHDIGKGVPGGEHSLAGAKLARKTLKKRKFSDKNIKSISFLIEHHLFLINVAKRRDIDDEETAIFCARKIKDADRLKMLYLLTIADSVSTGPNAWNTWTECLLRDLFFKVLEILETGELVSHRKEKSIQTKQERILSNDQGFTMPPKDLATLIESMPPRYLVNTTEKKIVEHIKLYETKSTSDFSLKIRKKKQSSNRTASICGADQPGFFSTIAGVFTLNNFDILDAQIYSWGKKTALDIFTLKPFFDITREGDRLIRVKSDLASVVKGNLDLNKALQNKAISPFVEKTIRGSQKVERVEIDNSSSSFFSIIEVYAYDFPGLLYSITNALYQCELNIVYAKIATHVDQVVDIFYVKTLYGGQVNSLEQISTIKKAILEAVRSSVNPKVG